MKTLRKVPCNDIEKGVVYVWVDEEGIATHSTVYGMWPVLCLGAKMFFKENEVIDTMEVTDDEYVKIISMYAQ